MTNKLDDQVSTQPDQDGSGDDSKLEKKPNPLQSIAEKIIKLGMEQDQQRAALALAHSILLTDEDPPRLAIEPGETVPPCIATPRSIAIDAKVSIDMQDKLGTVLSKSKAFDFFSKTVKILIEVNKRSFSNKYGIHSLKNTFSNVPYNHEIPKTRGQVFTIAQWQYMLQHKTQLSIPKNLEHLLKDQGAPDWALALVESEK